MMLSTEPLVRNVCSMGAWSHDMQDKPLARQVLAHFSTESERQTP